MKMVAQWFQMVEELLVILIQTLRLVTSKHAETNYLKKKFNDGNQLYLNLHLFFNFKAVKFRVL